MKNLILVLISVLLLSCSKDLPKNQINTREDIANKGELDDYGQAKKYLESNNIAEYLKYLEISAESGNKIAQNELAGLYAFGEYVPKDGSKFVYWSELAANQNYSLAQLNLGVAYFSGNNGVDQDIQKAEKWLKLAADNNEDIAKEYLKKIDNKEIPD